jgi:hypothetical protein
MPAATRRGQRTVKLFSLYIRHRKARQHRQLLRRRAVARARRANPQLRRDHFHIESDWDVQLSSRSSDSSESNTSSACTSSAELSGSDDSLSELDSTGQWSDILGPDWRFISSKAPTIPFPFVNLGKPNGNGIETVANG